MRFSIKPFQPDSIKKRKTKKIDNPILTVRTQFGIYFETLTRIHK